MYPDRSLVVGCPHMRCMTRGMGNTAASTGLPPGKAVAISHFSASEARAKKHCASMSCYAITYLDRVVSDIRAAR